MSLVSIRLSIYNVIEKQKSKTKCYIKFLISVSSYFYHVYITEGILRDKTMCDKLMFTPSSSNMMNNITTYVD